MQFVKPYKGLIFLGIILGVLKFIFPVMFPMIMKYALDGIIFNHDLSDSEKINKLIKAMGLILTAYILIRPFIEYYRQYIANHTANKILRDIRVVMFEHIQKLSLRFYSNSKTGEIISRVIFDVEQSKAFIMTGLMNIWLDMITVVIVIGIMLKLNVILTLISLIIFPLYMLSVKYFYKKFKEATKLRSQSLADVQSHLHERVQGMSVIMSFANKKTEEEKFNKKNDAFYEKSTLHAKRNAQTFATTNTIAEVAPLFVIFLAGFFVIKYDLTVGTMVAFVGLLTNLYTPLKRLADSSNILTQSVASIERIFELMDEPYDIEDKPGAKDIKINDASISLKDVSFSYDGENSILKNINLMIENGTTVAFVGESGGGKSSLINLIPRFYDTKDGEIMIDSTNIKDFTLKSLRKQIGIVSQENILFNESIIENIKMGKPDATVDEIIQAAKQAQAHDFITGFENGYETEIGEKGVKLSGGQKQRIALARAFLKDPSILVLDEATSALDLESEHLIQEALKTLSKNRTTLIVAHRLSTIVHADKIVYMEQGEIKEIGTHDELMNKKGSYYDLFMIQHLN